MAEKKEHGGPAFPVQGCEIHYKGETYFCAPHAGMTLRDYFAAHAPPFISETYMGLTRGECDGETWAQWAYDYADYMIAQRAKKDDE